jgi:hypothetical protein
MSAFLAIISNILASLAKAWFDNQAVINSGVEKQQLVEERQDNAMLKQAEDVRASVVPITVNSLPNHNATNDPDFRD